MYPEKTEIKCEEERTIRDYLQENWKLIEEIKNLSMENLDCLSGNGTNVEREELCTSNVMQILQWQNNDLKIIIEIVSNIRRKLGK